MHMYHGGVSPNPLGFLSISGLGLRRVLDLEFGSRLRETDAHWLYVACVCVVTIRTLKACTLKQTPETLRQMTALKPLSPSPKPETTNLRPAQILLNPKP